MLVTFVREHEGTDAPLRIGVSEHRAAEVIGAMTMEGWHVLSKVEGPSQSIVDSLQAALLQASTLPADAPIRIAVEFGVSVGIMFDPAA